jgi:hypothetical protein
MSAPAFEVPQALLTGLLQIVRAAVRAEVKALQDGDGEPWVAIDTHLGLSRREAGELARAGLVDGARKLGKRWRAKRSACDAAMERIGRAPAPLPAPASNDGDDQGADGVLAELGLVRVNGKGRNSR